MGNMFCTELRIHRKYDLKGSTQGRSTKKQNINENTTLKDLDLSYVFHVDKPWREALFRQIATFLLLFFLNILLSSFMVLSILAWSPGSITYRLWCYFWRLCSLGSPFWKIKKNSRFKWLVQIPASVPWLVDIKIIFYYFDIDSYPILEIWRILKMDNFYLYYSNK